MILKTRIDKLEGRAAGGGRCPHLPPIVRYFDTGGGEVTYTKPDAPTREQHAKKCDCGRARLRIHVDYFNPAQQGNL